MSSNRPTRIRGRGSATAGNASSITTNNTAQSSSRRPIVPNIAAAGQLVIKPKWADSKPSLSDTLAGGKIKVEPDTVNFKNEPGVSFKSEPLSPRRSPRHKPNEPTDNNRMSKGRGGRVGARTAKNKAGKGKREIIASEGVFSQGIGDELVGRGRGSKLKNVKGEEMVIGKLETGLDDFHTTAKLELSGDDKKLKREEKSGNIITYEELWESDDEMDREELQGLMSEGFISDLKKGDQMPFVLPTQDRRQFRALISKKALIDEEDEGDEMEVDDTEQTSTSTKESSRSRNQKLLSASKTIKGFSSAESSPLILFQLPPSLSRIGEHIQPAANKQAANGGLQQQQQQKHIQTDLPSQQQRLPNVSNSITTDKQEQHCLQSFSTGTQIGKLQFLRSGKVVLNIGGNRLDVAEAIPSNNFETLIRIETEHPFQPNHATPSGSGLLTNGAPSAQHLFSSPSSSSSAISNRFRLDDHGPGFDRTNTAQLLGPVAHHFICSVDISHLLTAGSQTMRRRETEGTSNGQQS